jgi:hypothetical protein
MVASMALEDLAVLSVDDRFVVAMVVLMEV